VPRTLYLSDDPRSRVPELFVAAGKVTTLRFETPCDPAQTKLLGGDGLFEPLLVGGRSVVIVPLRELEPEDRFLLQVTLVDGASLPFVVTAARHRVDGQVDVFPDPDPSPPEKRDASPSSSTWPRFLPRMTSSSWSSSGMEGFDKSVSCSNWMLLAPAYSTRSRPSLMLLTRPLRLSIAALLTCWSLACAAPGVSLRPDGRPGPEACSDKALEVMRILRLRPGEGAFMEIDANQVHQSPITLTDGPVESVLTEELGLLPVPTRLYGRIWTGGAYVVIRYYEARPPDGDPIPICGVARDDRGGLIKRPDSRPGIALLDNSGAAVWIVDAFR
jgi:hypothetical protein